MKGRILDSKTLAPVEYANIVLLDSVTRSMITGVVSDSAGFFRISNVSPGTYFVEYTFIGYQKLRTRGFTISRKKPVTELGELQLVPSAVTMDEVTVTAEKSLMITKIDRKIFNVQKDVMAQTGTVLDVLQTIPSVSVDVDGNISLRGSSNVTILINDRPSVMAGSVNLEQMPASLVERIEVITNPSARYRPDGTGGIINIILKKEQNTGMNGSIAANAGTDSRFNTNLQLNYKKGKVNLFGSYGFRQDYRRRSGNIYSKSTDTAVNQSVSLWQNSLGSVRPHSHLGQLGVDWDISKKDATSITGTYHYRDVKRNDVSHNIYKGSDLSLSEDFTRSLTGKQNENSAGVTAYYQHTFNRGQEHILKADIEYENQTENENDLWNSNYLFPVYPEGKDSTIAKNKGQNIDLTVDYSRPLWKDASLEAGYAGTMEITDQDQQVAHWDSISGGWISDLESSNRFYASQTVHALYTTVSYEWKKLSVMGGLRAEEALLSLEFRTKDTTVKRSYFALYPTIHLGLASGKNEWQLNYSHRVNRPDPDEMNPVPEYRDPRNIFTGNPDLKPEDIHSVEFGYAIRADNLTFVPSLFYRYVVHGFTTVTHSFQDTILITTMQNLATNQSAGLDLSGNWQVKKVAGINFSASGFYNQIDASNIGYSSNKSSFSWNVKVNASISITRTTLFQFNGQYRSEALTPQGMRRPSWVVNLGFRQDFLKKKLSLIATVSDLFDSQAWKNSINTPLLIQESTRRRDARVFYGGLVFHFGGQNQKEKEPKFEFENGGEK